MNSPIFTSADAICSTQTLLDFVIDLFTASAREQWDRTSILIALNALKHDPDLFDREAVLLYEESVSEMQS